MSRNGTSSLSADSSSNCFDVRQFYEQIMHEQARRLRLILDQLKHEDILLKDLRLELEISAVMLETAHREESLSRCVVAEDDELGTVQWETMSPDVRDWLGSTFTEQQRKFAERLKRSFKSVAQQIWAGVKINKLYEVNTGRTASRVTEDEDAEMLNDCSLDGVLYSQDIDSWDFDVFTFDVRAKGSGLKEVGIELFRRNELTVKFKIPPSVLANYLSQLQLGYNKCGNMYHNAVHAADVAQTMHAVLTQTTAKESLTALQLFACIFSALIHDYEHTGQTNNFHIQARSDFALLYNDRSVLENHHVSACFRLLKDPKMNITAALNGEEYREFRALAIHLVLATDMSSHFKQMKRVKTALASRTKITDMTPLLAIILHCCDISHPTKPWNMHKEWTRRVTEEFFAQGDLEASLGIAISPLCDRHSVRLAESQIGFIDFVVSPSFSVLSDVLKHVVSSKNGALTASNDGGENSGSSSHSASPTNDFAEPWKFYLQENRICWKEMQTADGAFT